MVVICGGGIIQLQLNEFDDCGEQEDGGALVLGVFDLQQTLADGPHVAIDQFSSPLVPS
jgi:hypothetical protein